jgi:hypothetical protein
MNLLERLEETIALPLVPLGGPPSGAADLSGGRGDLGLDLSELEQSVDSETGDSDDSIEESAVSAQGVRMVVNALSGAPKLRAAVTKALKQGGVSDESAVDAVVSAITLQLGSLVPLAMRDAGVDVKKSIAGKAVRSTKAMAAGRGVAEAHKMSDDEYAAILAEELAEELAND